MIIKVESDGTVRNTFLTDEQGKRLKLVTALRLTQVLNADWHIAKATLDTVEKNNDSIDLVTRLFNGNIKSLQAEIDISDEDFEKIKMCESSVIGE